MKCIIAEKSNVAQKIANVLGTPKKIGDHYEVGDYIVCYARGHLVSLSLPDAYNDEWKFWNLKSLPLSPTHFKTEINSKKDVKALFYHIKEQVLRKDVDEIYCATDAGREGQLIFQLIYDQIGCKKPVKRLWFSSLEDKAILTAFKEMKPNSQYNGYYEEAIGRAEADWLVGMNLTRLYSIMYGPLDSRFKSLNVGRVQTPTLAMIVQRENEIKNFVKKPYFELDAIFDGFTARWFDEDGSKIEQRLIVDQIIEECKDKQATVEDVISKNIVVNRPKLFYLTDLQREAFKKFKYSPKYTLELAQKLYEKGLITYPRTDSPYLTDEFLDVYPTLLNSIYSAFPETHFVIERLAKQNLLIDKNIIGKVSDHHAIITTELLEEFDLDSLEKVEMGILKLIIERMLIAVDRPYIYNELKSIFAIDKHHFKHIAHEIIQRGWKDSCGVFTSSEDDESEEEIQAFVDFEIGECYNVKNFEILTKETKPQNHFTYSTILSAMEHAGRKIVDDDLRDEMKSVSLGTEATRATILDELLNHHYISLNAKKQLIPEKRGVELIDRMVDQLVSPDLTGSWEKDLGLIKDNRMTVEAFIKNINEFILEVIDSKKDDEAYIEGIKKEEAKQSNYTSNAFLQNACPICGSHVYENTKTYYCAKWKAQPKCEFKVWKDDFSLKNRGIVLNEDEYKVIIKGGQIQKQTESNTYTVELERNGKSIQLKTLPKN